MILNDEYGTLTDARTLRIERSLPGPVERVWSFLTDSDKRSLWLAAGDMTQAEGARVELVWRNANLNRPGDTPPPGRSDYSSEHRLVCVITECDPPHRLSFTWGEPGPDRSEVTFELEPAGERVHLTLTHRQLPNAEFRLGVSSGWHAHLAILAARLEATEVESFWSMHQRLEGEYRTRIGDQPI